MGTKSKLFKKGGKKVNKGLAFDPPEVVKMKNDAYMTKLVETRRRQKDRTDRQEQCSPGPHHANVRENERRMKQLNRSK